METQIQIIMHPEWNDEEHELFKVSFNIAACQYYLIVYVSLQEMLEACTMSRDSVNDLTATDERKRIYLCFRNFDTKESIKNQIERVLRNLRYLRNEEDYHYVASYLSEELERTIKFLTGKEETIKNLELLP